MLTPNAEWQQRWVWPEWWIRLTIWPPLAIDCSDLQQITHFHLNLCLGHSKNFDCLIGQIARKIDQKYKSSKSAISCSLVYNRNIILDVTLVIKWYLITVCREHLVNETLRWASTSCEYLIAWISVEKNTNTNKFTL